MHFLRQLKNFLHVNADPEYTHMALVRLNGNSSLLEIDAVRAMCELESKLTGVHSYKGFCQRKFYVKECCRPWSIPNYITLLANKTTCHEIEVTCELHLHFSVQIDKTHFIFSEQRNRTFCKWSSCWLIAISISPMEVWKVIAKAKSVLPRRNACNSMRSTIFFTFWPTMDWMWA